MPSIPGCKLRGKHPYQRLTALHVRHLKKGRYADGLNLYLKVDESGARRWMWRLAGYMPPRYEHPMLAWAESKREALEAAWRALKTGDGLETAVEA